MNTYKRAFRHWCKRKGIRLRKSVQGLSAGQLVRYRNPYGVLCGPYEILGFDRTPDNGRCVYLNWECWWFPVCPERLIKVSKI